MVEQKHNKGTMTIWLCHSRIAMFMRDTAFKFRQQGVDLTKAALNNITAIKTNYQGVYNVNSQCPKPI